MDSRLPPPQGAFGPPPSYAFVTRVYRKSLRPIVLAVAFPALLWTLFGNAGLDQLGSVPGLKTVYIVLGALYMVVAGIELFGLVAAATQRVPLVRLYAYLSALVVLIIAGTGLLEIVTHFTMKGNIISTCTNLSKDGTIVYFGFWGPSFHDLSDSEAASLCQHYWDRDSWQEIVAFLVTTVLAFFFSAVAFSYLRQVLDPSSIVNASRAPSYGARNAAYPPPHYNPPYNGQYNQPYYGQPAYGYGDDAFVPPYEAKPGYTAPENKAGYGEDSKDPFGDQHASGSRV
ncbi:hypothetical protein P691DRAFT_756708 [Macrolepiota fuliginosa MF-IS2]|uniref:Uncharacterized protein n=1 Tax=Macrolepiota fuliginosa MF-IS2 TaxID=1400762 RepID=A0A9P5XM63_9AGAR|nr:hypothetical protein P691DRAFT_756708 [Macrolepiota fuliginosa MF-IS2]